MIDFPNSPTIGQVFTSGGLSWTWDGTKWNMSTVAGGPYVPLGGGTMTGPLVLSGDPTAPLVAATKQYVDDVIAGDNRVINGDMRIDQRNAGAGGTTIGVYTVDRWIYGATQASKGQWSRYTGGPSWLGLGFGYYLGFTSSSAYASLAADIFNFTQKIEADMISDFAWGTANAQPVTLSFLAASSLGGAFSGSLANTDGSRSYPFSFSLTANTITKITVTIPGDTGGTWTLQGNGVGLFVRFDLGCGSSNRGPAGAWASANYTGVTGSVSVVGTNAATFNVTGVKLEIGSVATPYNRQSLAKSMADCQRYYQQFPQPLLVSGYNGASTVTSGQSMALPVSMRATPTVGLGTPVYSNMATLAVGAVDAYSVRANATMQAAGPGWGVASPLTLNAEL